MGLNFAKTYLIRCAQINGSNQLVSAWNTYMYTTVGYPLAEIINSTDEVVRLKYPIHKLQQYTSSGTYLWIDKLPDFSSPNAFKEKWVSSSDVYYLPLYQNHDTFYIRSKVVDTYDSLPWKTKKVITDFGPIMKASSWFPCSDTTGIDITLSYNIAGSLKNRNAKVYLLNDTFIGTTNTLFLKLYSNDSIRMISEVDMTDDTFHVHYRDTSYFHDFIKTNDELTHSFINDTVVKLRFFTNYCSTIIELEQHSDTFFNSLLNRSVKKVAKNARQIDFPINLEFPWSYGFRYRVKYGIETGPWHTIHTSNYKPIIKPNTPYSTDTTISRWFYARLNTMKGATLQVELDTSNQFNTSKKKTYYQRDTNLIYIESLFGAKNYSRCRLVSSTDTTQWSDTAYKNFSFGPVNQYNMSFSYPFFSYTLRTSNKYSGTRMRFGYKPNELKFYIDREGMNFLDTFNFVHSDPVYYSLQRYTPIDSTAWSEVFSSTFNIDPSVCVLPKIIYNGFRNGLDTFHLRWFNKAPTQNSIMNIYFGPKPKSFKAILYSDSGSNHYVVNRKLFPLDWWFAVYPDCPPPRNFTSQIPTWFQLSGNKTELEETEFKERSVYYHSSSHFFVNSSELELDIQLLDCNGKLIFKERIAPNSNSSNLNISEGIYFLRITNTNLLTYSYPIFIN
jgi:hypothetical protein